MKKFAEYPDTNGEDGNIDDVVKPTEYTELKSVNLKSKMENVKFIENNDDGSVVLEGNIIAEGTWNGYHFSKKVLEELDPSIIQNIKIDVGPDHINKIEDVGTLNLFKWDDEERAWWIKCTITDEKAIEVLKSIENLGFSIETDFVFDTIRLMVDSITSIERVVAVDYPACKVCYIE